MLTLSHIRAYRIWCENNYSSMEHIDVQWVVRYLIMLFVTGLSYGYMIVSDNPCRAFTQNLLLQFLFVYSVSEILFRKDPWEEMLAESQKAKDAPADAGEEAPDAGEEAAVSDESAVLRQWMEQEKPYLNPDFKLMDLRVVLPKNRTYLSQFVNDHYGCTFYQLVSRYRVEEAKRVMREHPEKKMAEVAVLSGFSSQAVLSHTFSRETGLTPREWCKNGM